MQEVLQYIITVSTVLWDMAMHTYTLDITYNTSVMVLLYTYSKKQKQKKISYKTWMQASVREVFVGDFDLHPSRKQSL